MIKISNINKFYNKGKANEIHVIDNVSLTLPDTGFVSILGKSGSGKTTLLNVIGGLDKASGTIFYDEVKIKNYNMNKIDKFRRNYIGYVFQNYNLLKSKTVWENLEIALEAINITDKEEVKSRIEYSLKAVGLYKFRKKPAFALSGGQMQRVSIARALVKNSKIIIADEPTGNLDSDNSIEIMNILKKLSKNSLVLLVTHDKQLAEFYSDSIIELCDGKIENIRETNNDAKLSGIYDNNKIFLEDYSKAEGGDGILNYKIYFDEDISNIELTFIKKNNQLFLQSNQKIKLLEDTNLKIVEKRMEIDKNEITNDFNFDTSFFVDKKSVNIFKGFFKNLKDSIKNFFVTRKRTKFFHFAFFLIGIVLASLNITYVSYSKINNDYLTYDKNIYGLENYNSIAYDEALHQKYIDFVDDAFTQGKINKFYSSNTVNIYTSVNFSSFDTRGLNINFLSLGDELIQEKEIIAGKHSTKNEEIVLSQTLADQFLKKLNFEKNDYNSLLGKSLNYSYMKEMKIVGIVKSDSMACYYKDTKVQSEYYYSTIDINNFEISYKYANQKFCEYEIVSGRDISSRFEGLVGETSSFNIGDIIGKITIVGKYKTQSEETYVDNYELSVDNYTKINLPFNSSTETIIINDSTFSYFENFQRNSYTQSYFSINNLEDIKAFANGRGFTLLNSYDILENVLIENNHQAKYTLLPVIIILISITLIYIYFSTRSKMISDIYSIGVMRALGFSRKRITAKYVVEILITTIFTSLLGYILLCAGYNFLAVKFTEIGILMSTVADYYSTYVFGAALLFTNVIFGIIPVISLMRKSPSEIIAKYDI